jgi:hypothetical protein
VNTSATGGYLRETTTPLSRQGQENALQEMVVGLTGLAPELVRPAFQESPLAEPGLETDWCAFHIRDSEATNFPDVQHVSPGSIEDGHDVVTDWINKEVRLYFYGPRAEDYAGMVRRGLQVEQNLSALRSVGIALRRVGNAAQMPELVNGKWLSRVDLVLYITLEQSGSYAVLNLLQARADTRG